MKSTSCWKKVKELEKPMVGNEGPNYWESAFPQPFMLIPKHFFKTASAGWMAKASQH